VKDNNIVFIDNANEQYKNEDSQSFNYGLYEKMGYLLRSPEPQSERYISCIGAAQTFGRYCHDPYPNLINNFLDIDVYNMGFAGAGPMFSAFSDLLPIINNSKVCIIQIMSGRSSGNSLWNSYGTNFGMNKETGKGCVAQKFWEYYLEKYDIDKVLKLREENRGYILQGYKNLLSSITVPKVLFLFTTKKNKDREDIYNVYDLFGDFPHMITDDLIQEISSHCDRYIECVTSKGLPQRLPFRKFNDYEMQFLDGTKRQITHNNYYPSQEMHFDAFDALKPVVEEYI